MDWRARGGGVAPHTRGVGTEAAETGKKKGLCIWLMHVSSSSSSSSSSSF